MAVAERSPSVDVLAVSLVRRAALEGVTKKARECSRVTLEELGALVDVAPATIARWESGLRSPRTDAARRYTRAIELLLATLTEDCDPAVIELRDALRAARRGTA